MASNPEGRFRRDIEGLRAVAVVAVVLYHAHVPHFGGGFVGVDVFFVISGFLITGQLLRDDAVRPLQRIGHFYARRIRRIVPAATVVILGTLIGAALLQNGLLRRTTRDDALAATFFFSNVRFANRATDYFAQGGAPSLFQHFWSLSAEEQFYVLWPALLVGITVVAATRRRSTLTVLLTLLAFASFALGVRLTETDPGFAFFQLPARAWELCIGALLALHSESVRLSPRLTVVVRGVGLALIAAALVVIDDGTPFPGTAALLPVLGAAAVVAAGIPSLADPGRVLSGRVMQLGGRYSYSLYLWHWPVLLLAGLAAPSLTAHWPSSLLVMALIALPGAMASYHLVEHPFRTRFNRRIDRDSLTAGAALVGACALALVPFDAAAAAPALHARRTATGPVAPANATDFVPSNLRPPLTHTNAFNDLRKVVSCRPGGKRCVAGDASSSRTIVLYGDSHASHWAIAFGLMGQRNGWRIELITRPACRSFVEPTGPLGGDCENFRADANAQIRASRPALVVFSNRSVGYFDQDRAAWSRGIAAALAQLPAGVSAAVLSQTPISPENVPVCLADHLRATRACEPSASNREVGELNASMESVARANGAAFVDLTSWFCGATRCPVIMGNVLVYRDVSHLTGEFTRSRADALADLLRPLLR